MKFVVPLTIPSTRWTLVTTSDSRSTLITGIAAHTEASKRSWRPRRAAAAKSSRPAARRAACSPSRRSGPSRAARGRASPAGSTPPITSATSAIDASSEHVRGVGREHAGAWIEGALARGVADRGPDDPEPVACGALDLVALLCEQAVDGRADGPVAEERYGNVNGLHSCPRVA
jgi:hypothetical protein